MVFALCGMAAVSVWAASPKTKKEAAVVFKNLTYDFGTIKEADGKVHYDFSFTNTGNSPLVIIMASPGCGCVKATYPDSPVAPGKSGVISVTFNPRGQAGDFFKTITVKTNAPKTKRTKLSVSGCVVPK